MEEEVEKGVEAEEDQQETKNTGRKTSSYEYTDSLWPQNSGSGGDQRWWHER